MTDQPNDQRVKFDDLKFIIIKDDRFWRSLTTDVVTFGSLIGVVGVGIWLDSWLLQLIGAIFWIIGLVSRFMDTTKSRFTIEEAREEIERLAKN